MPIKTKILTLLTDQTKKLTGMFKRGRWSPRELTRAKILLLAEKNEGFSNMAISLTIGCGRETVRRTREQFLKEGLDGALFDRPRPGQPKKLTRGHKNYIIFIAGTSPPRGSSRWTIKLLRERFINRKKINVSLETVRKVLLDSKLLKPKLFLK